MGGYVPEGVLRFLPKKLLGKNMGSPFFYPHIKRLISMDRKYTLEKNYITCNLKVSQWKRKIIWSKPSWLWVFHDVFPSLLFEAPNKFFFKAFRKESTNLTSETDTKREKHFQPATNVLSSLKTNGWNLNINGWISFWDGLVSGANC